MKNIMPQLTQIQDIRIAGISVRTKNEDEYNPKTARLPELWEAFFAEQKDREPLYPIYGVYHHYESDVSGYYSVTAGIEIEELDLERKMSDMVQIEAGSYLVFEANGSYPSAIINAWQDIWEYFNNEVKLKRSYRSDFELYKAPQESAIYIGVINSG